MSLQKDIVFKRSVSSAEMLQDEQDAAFKAGISLLIVWLIAIVVGFCLYFFTVAQDSSPFGNNQNIAFIKKQHALMANQKEPAAESSAFVFVNMNKKFFLTRFPGGNQSGDSLMTANEAGAANLNTEQPTVIRKVKATPKKSSYTDFSIKPVPQ